MFYFLTKIKSSSTSELDGLTGAVTVTALMSGSGFDVEGWHCREGGHAGERGHGRESRHGGDSGQWHRG